MSITHRVKRLLGVSLAGAMVLALMPAGIAAADMHVISTDDVEACDLEAYVTPEFDDFLGSFAGEIECMASYGITQGDTEGNYNPSGTVTRQQMALFIARLASQALNGNITGIPSFEDDAFDDIADINPPEARDAINWLAELEITVGAEGGDSYNPSGPVTRQQMASFIARAHLALTVNFDGTEVDDDRFTDVDADNVHADNINLLAAAGVVAGTGDGTTYSPTNPVTRGQMSAFVVRSIGVLESQDLWNGVPTVDLLPTATVTAAPELVNVEFVTASDTQTALSFNFDEDLVAETLTPADFTIHGYDTAVSVGATSAAVDSDDPTSVIAVFTNSGDVAYDDAVVAAVAVDAVSDLDGLGSLAGSSPLNDVTASIDVPVLTSVGNFVAGDDDNDATVDFTFDRDVETPANNDADWRLLRSNGDYVTSIANTENVDIDDNVVTVSFDSDVLTASIWGTVRRGVIAAAAVEDAVKHSVDVGNGVTILPDVTEIEVEFDDTTLDEADISVTFDSAVADDAANSLTIYHDNPGVVGSTSTTVTFDAGTLSNSDRTITFAGETLATDIFYVAVVDLNDTNVSTVALGGASFEAGETAGPEIDGFTIEVTDTDLLTGDALEYTLTVEFTEDVDNPTSVTAEPYFADGSTVPNPVNPAAGDEGNEVVWVFDVEDDGAQDIDEEDLLAIVALVFDGDQEDVFGYASYPLVVGLG